MQLLDKYPVITYTLTSRIESKAENETSKPLAEPREPGEV